MNARGVAEPLAGAARRRGADPRLRRGRPARRCSRGEVHYARDAFEGLSLMDRVMAAKRGGAAGGRPGAGGGAGRAPGAPGAAARAWSPTTLPELDDDVGALRRGHRRAGARRRRSSAPGWSRASRWPTTRRCSTSGPPSSASGACAAPAAATGPSYEELVETEGRPRLRYWLDRLVADQVLEAAVVYGYFPAYSEGNDLVVLDENGARRAGPVHLPAPAPRPAAVPGRLLPAAGVRRDSTWSRCSWSPWASRISEYTAELFAAQRLPRLPGGARPVGAADRGAGRVLAPADPRGAGPARRATAGRRRPGRPGRHSCAPTTAAAGTRSATRPARTWRTGRRSSSCSTPSGSAWSCPRSSSCTRSSPRRDRRAPPGGELLQAK